MHPLPRTLSRVAAVAARGGTPVVIFDLDGTLLSTAARHLAILRAFGWRTADPEVAGVVGRSTLADLRWSADEPLRAAGVGDAVALDALQRLWDARYFTDEACLYDPPVGGAVRFVRAAAAAGAVVVYLSARVASRMEAGTVETLRAWGFPLPGARVALRLKPSAGQGDRAFKADALGEVGRLGEVVATFENDTAQAHLFMDAFPGAAHHLLDTGRAPDAPPPRPALVVLRDWWW